MMKKIKFFSIVFWLCFVLPLFTWAGNTYRIAMLDDDLPGHDRSLNQLLEKTLLEGGFTLERLDALAICDANLLNRERFDLLILPNAASLPMDSMPAIESFLEQGGDLLALRAPAFTQLLWRSGTTWFSESDWRQRLSEIPTANGWFDFDSEDLSAWRPSSNSSDSQASYELAEGYRGKGLHVHIRNMNGWDTYASPELANPFPEGHSLLCFYAKGYGETRSLSMECIEKDGSRWIAVFPVTDQWTRVVLTPSDFKFWESVPGRGGRGDGLNPQNVLRMTVGVAYSHTGLRAGEYEYFIDELGTAANPYGDMSRIEKQIPKIEGLCPSYKFYPMSDVARIQPGWLPLKAIQPKISIPNVLYAHHPRPTGKGFAKDRNWRWIPLLNAFGSKGEWRGAPAGMYLDCEEKMRGSVRVYFSIKDADWYKQDAFQKMMVPLLDRLSSGVFLMEGGSEFFTYRKGDEIRLGSTTANVSSATQSITLSYTLHSGNIPIPSWIENEKSISPGEIQTASIVVPLASEDTVFSVTTVLMVDSKPVDQICHDFYFIEPKPQSDREFVTTSRGDFMLDGKKWYVHGVNYMPSTGIGTERGSYFENWIDKEAYDPEFIQRDLERCRDLGLNSVSIFIYHHATPSKNLFDILRRCDLLGLKVNLSIRPGTPMKYDWNHWKNIIESHRLWEWDVIYAYDIAWEPFFGNEPQRREYDPDWQWWIEQKYGSIEAAEKGWGFPLPRLDDRVTSPPATLLGQDGSHRKMVADYRTFVDELIQSKYQEAADQIRALDPNHLISFRMTVAGDPTYPGDTNMPYDFKAIARCMDFIAPEGYGRIGDWNQIKPGIFTVAYARYYAPEKPVLWAEAGVHVWDEQAMQSDPQRLESQGRFYEDFYRMLLQSHSNGIVWWWYPGGYRANERSDYGIVNPDGTDRPNSRIIRQYADKILQEKTIPTPDVWIPIDRDADARGLFGIYERVKDSFWSAIDAGKTPGLK